MTTEDKRAQVRQMVAAAHARGDQVGWFEDLYAAAARGEAIVPWADLEPNPALMSWAEQQGLTGDRQRALVVGCGLGDDAQFLADLGFRVVAFDIAETAVLVARNRFPESSVEYVAADVLNPPDGWTGAFDFVFEAYTIQVLRDEIRSTAIDRVTRFVAPGGRLLVVARARDEQDDPGLFPWPLLRHEIDAFATGGLEPTRVEEIYDDEDPPVRRWRAEFERGR